VGYILPPLRGFCTEHGSNTAWFPALVPTAALFRNIGSKLPQRFDRWFQTAAWFPSVGSKLPPHCGSVRGQVFAAAN